MHNLIIMIGAPGSGKSTYLKKYAIDGKVISRDVIRYSLLKEGDEYFSKEHEVYRIFIDEIRKSLDENQNTYVDATNLNKYSRNKLLSAIGLGYLQDVNIIAVIKETPLSVCMERNGRRNAREKVPNNELQKMYKNLTIPDLYTEPLIKKVYKVTEDSDVLVPIRR